MMKLMEDSGQVAFVLIDGVEWTLSSKEYRTMLYQSLHRWPFHLKRLNPGEHSCARCIHRPIDFMHSTARTNTNTHNGVCRCGMWSRSAPFYDNFICEYGEWPEEIK